MIHYLEERMNDLILSHRILCIWDSPDAITYPKLRKFYDECGYMVAGNKCPIWNSAVVWSLPRWCDKHLPPLKQLAMGMHTPGLREWWVAGSWLTLPFSVCYSWAGTQGDLGFCPFSCGAF